MENSSNDKEMEVLFSRFMKTFVENRDPRLDLETDALKQLSGVYLEKAKKAILTRLEKSPDHDAIWCVVALNLTEAAPVMERWLNEIRSNPTSKHGHPSCRGQLAYTLYSFTKDLSYIHDVIDVVKSEGYGDSANGVSYLGKMPLTMESISAVWGKYKTGQTIKEPDAWKESCAEFLREKIKEPIGQRFWDNLPGEEQKELLELTGENRHQRLERKFRLEKYIYGSERYDKEDLNRYNEYIKIGGSPIKGITLKHLWKGHIGSINKVAWSPNGYYLASSPGRQQDNLIRIWNLGSGQCIKELNPLKIVADSQPDSQCFAWVGNRQNSLAVFYNYATPKAGKVFLWNVNEEKPPVPILGVTTVNRGQLTHLWVKSSIACDGLPR